MEVKNLSFAYEKKSGANILDDISFQINDSKITTFLGANGCGKSTLFQLMTKNLVPDKGTVLLGGESVHSISQKSFAKKVAAVHQSHFAARDITVEKLVSYGRTPHLSMFGILSKEDKDYVTWAMEVTNTIKYRDREVSKLSGGQKQRVYMAMALAQKTDILFLDEPTTYLDIRYQIELLELIKKLNKDLKITIIMVLHDMNHAIYYSDEIIGLKDGKVFVQGEANQVITSECIHELYGIKLEVKSLNNQKIVITVRE